MSNELELPVRCGCGGEAEIIKHPNGKYTVSCTRGGCMANVGWCPDEKTAIEAWNKAMGNRDNLSRVEHAVKPEWWDGCSEKGWYKCTCGKGVYDGQSYCSQCGARLEWSVNELCVQGRKGV